MMQARSNKHKAKQHSILKVVTFPKKNELPRVGLEPTTLYTLDRALYMYSFQIWAYRMLARRQTTQKKVARPYFSF